jgi:hypothetical protein
VRFIFRSDTVNTTSLISLIATFLRLAVPGHRLQLYPFVGSDGWWSAVTNDDGPVEGLSQLAPEVLEERLAELGTHSGREISPEERTSLTTLLTMFAAWAERVPEGCTDGGPALVFTQDGSGYVFYDGQDLASWSTIAQALAAITELTA